jgi:hypothetical protein
MKRFSGFVQHGKDVRVTTKVTVGSQRPAGQIDPAQPGRMKTQINLQAELEPDRTRTGTITDFLGVVWMCKR